MEPQALCSQPSTLQTHLTLTPALAWLAYFALFPTGEAEEANGDFAPVGQAAEAGALCPFRADNVEVALADALSFPSSTPAAWQERAVPGYSPPRGAWWFGPNGGSCP